MPTNNYKCECGKEWQFIGPYQPKNCPDCNLSIEPSLPVNVHTPSVFEVVDTAHNVKWRDNFEERAKKRNAAGSKPTVKELARENGKDPKDFGYTEDDPTLI